ncbi:MAG TPA: hypothetical protein VLX85_01185, partial [Stellaceae bacterium]|nr:hypothetical protein [Stellaceae bacterium]
KLGLVALAVGLVAGFGTSAAQARVFVGIGVGVPFYPYYPPAYYYPPPVVYVPPPVYAAPAAPAYVQQPTSQWYYCDNPQGYYPTVQSCSTGWRPVPAR